VADRVRRAMCRAERHDCDSPLAQLLDGISEVPDLVQVFGNDATGPGIHSGSFRWTSAGGLITAEPSGVTNAGTHRPKLLECQRWKAPGFLQGQLCGTVVRAREKRLRDAYIFGEYLMAPAAPRRRFHAQDDVIGTLEGLVGVPCHD
jgi:hypothetical protein